MSEPDDETSRPDPEVPPPGTADPEVERAAQVGESVIASLMPAVDAANAEMARVVGPIASMMPAVDAINAQMARALIPVAEETERWRAGILDLIAPALSTFTAAADLQKKTMARALAQFDSASLMRLFGSQPLSRSGDFQEPDDPRGAYSPELRSAGSYFGRHERVVDSWAEFNASIATLLEKVGDLPLVWRGARDADWGLYSHLYRHLLAVNGVLPPEDEPEGDQNHPDEDQMVRAEAELLRVARTDWRFDGLSALEVFARVQHFGGPTRLIDVSMNPYIAAWFAVESAEATDERDSRLFALATVPVSRSDRPPYPDSRVELDDLGAARTPFWHAAGTTALRQQIDWGTGARRRIWVPPAYEQRIAAQNAAFVLDGVPMTSARTAPYFSMDTKNSYWRRADLLAAASIYAKTASATRKPQYNARNFAPTFSFRITSRAKSEIRRMLESRFGYRHSYIYPDVSGLADLLKRSDLALPSS